MPGRQVRASSGPLPGSDAVSMPSRPSNTATNSAINIENLLGLAAKQLSSTPVDQVRLILSSSSGYTYLDLRLLEVDSVSLVGARWR